MQIGECKAHWQNAPSEREPTAHLRDLVWGGGGGLKEGNTCFWGWQGMPAPLYRLSQVTNVAPQTEAGDQGLPIIVQSLTTTMVPASPPGRRWQRRKGGGDVPKRIRGRRHRHAVQRGGLGLPAMRQLRGWRCQR